MCTAYTYTSTHIHTHACTCANTHTHTHTHIVMQRRKEEWQSGISRTFPANVKSNILRRPSKLSERLLPVPNSKLQVIPRNPKRFHRILAKHTAQRVYHRWATCNPKWGENRHTHTHARTHTRISTHTLKHTHAYIHACARLHKNQLFLKFTPFPGVKNSSLKLGVR